METFKIVITGRFYGELLNSLVELQAECGRLAIEKAASVSGCYLIWHNRTNTFLGINPQIIDYHILQEGK
jgi:hypothetical protein